MTEVTELAELDAASRNALADSDFAYIDSQGDRHLPINDADHVRNALARFNQTSFESHMAKAKAARKIRAAAKKLGVELGDHDLEMSDGETAEPSMTDTFYVTELADPAITKAGPKLYRKQLLKFGNFIYKDGVLKLTKELGQQLIQNFNDKVLDNVGVPLGHAWDDKDLIENNTGHVVGLEAAGDGVDALLEISDPKTQERIDKGLVRGISAGFVPDYVDKATGKVLGPVLKHAALVAEPFLKGMRGFASVALSDEDKDRQVVQVALEEAPVTPATPTPESTETPAAAAPETPAAAAPEAPAAPETPAAPAAETPTETPAAEGETPEAAAPTAEAPKAPEGQSEGAEPTVPAAEPAAEAALPEAGAEQNVPATGEGEPLAGAEPTNLSVENAKLKREIALKDAQSQYTDLLDKGQIVPAQKDSFIALLTAETSQEATVNLSDGSTKSVRELVLSLISAQPKISLSDERGQDQKPKEAPEVELTDQERAMAKQLGMSDEQLINFKLEHADQLEDMKHGRFTLKMTT